MSSVHGLKVKRKNINVAIRKCHSQKFALNTRLFELQSALNRVDSLILMKRGNK